MKNLALCFQVFFLLDFYLAPQCFSDALANEFSEQWIRYISSKAQSVRELLFTNSYFSVKRSLLMRAQRRFSLPDSQPGTFVTWVHQNLHQYLASVISFNFYQRKYFPKKMCCLIHLKNSFLSCANERVSSHCFQTLASCSSLTLSFLLRCS